MPSLLGSRLLHTPAGCDLIPWKIKYRIHKTDLQGDPRKGWVSLAACILRVHRVHPHLLGVEGLGPWQLRWNPLAFP